MSLLSASPFETRPLGPPQGAAERDQLLLLSNSEGSPGQQASSAERDQYKTGPIRFDSKPRSRCCGLQSIARLSGAKSPPTT